MPQSQLQDDSSGPRSSPPSAEAGFHGLRQRPTLLLGQLLWTQSSEYSLWTPLSGSSQWTISLPHRNGARKTLGT